MSKEQPYDFPAEYTRRMEQYIEEGVAQLKHKRLLFQNKNGTPFGVVESKRPEVQRLNLAQVTPGQEMALALRDPRAWMKLQRRRENA